jgi:hypothetical protein
MQSHTKPQLDTPKWSALLVEAVNKPSLRKPMSTSPQTTVGIEPTAPTAEACSDDRSQSFRTDAPPQILTCYRLLAAEAMMLLIRLERDLREARAQFNQDWFRRVMRVRPKAVSRLRRRWSKIAPTPPVPLGSLRRRYHANLTMYLYGS